MLIACASNQESEDDIMSNYCKDAYENLYKTYNQDNLGPSNTHNAMDLLFLAADNYAKKEEFERLEKECN